MRHQPHEILTENSMDVNALKQLLSMQGGGPQGPMMQPPQAGPGGYAPNAGPQVAQQPKGPMEQLRALMQSMQPDFSPDAQRLQQMNEEVKRKTAEKEMQRRIAEQQMLQQMDDVMRRAEEQKGSPPVAKKSFLDMTEGGTPEKVQMSPQMIMELGKQGAL
jgi:hypothetical protein